jgi:hypothetical protein
VADVPDAGGPRAVEDQQAVQLSSTRRCAVGDINPQDFYLDNLPNVDHFTGVTNIAMRQLRYVYETVLMNPNIDKGPEICDIAHDPFQDHVFLQIGKGCHVGSEVGHDEFLARITAWFQEFLSNVLQRIESNVFIDKLLQLQGGDQLGVGNRSATGTAREAAIRSTTSYDSGWTAVLSRY